MTTQLSVSKQYWIYIWVIHFSCSVLDLCCYLSFLECVTTFIRNEKVLSIKYFKRFWQYILVFRSTGSKGNRNRLNLSLTEIFLGPGTIITRRATTENIKLRTIQKNNLYTLAHCFITWFGKKFKKKSRFLFSLIQI